MSVRMKPMNVFVLAGKKVIQCRVLEGTPQGALETRLVYEDEGRRVPIVLRGISTAWGSEEGVFDFSFEGSLEPPLTPSPAAVVREAD